MKIAILGDCHFGMRQDSLLFASHYRRFYNEVFFPILESHNVSHIIQLGDLWDRRKFINFNTLYQARKDFFDKLKNKYHMTVLVGNHDIYYRNTLQVNSLELLLSDYVNSKDISIVSHPTTVEYDGVAVDCIPWICSDNEQSIKEFIGLSKSQICCGHFEIAGFQQEAGHVCQEGMDRDSLDKYEMVISGHFHHKSTDGHIFYVGSPGEITWNDYEESRGFHILDLNCRELQFFENPFRIHYKLMYDDSNMNLEDINKQDFSYLKDCIVKVFIQTKNNSMLFDAYMDSLQQAGARDISIIETQAEVGAMNVLDGTNTIDLIDKCVDEVADSESLDKNHLKELMKQLYFQANDLEQI